MGDRDVFHFVAAVKDNYPLVVFAHEFIFKSLRQSLHRRRIYTCTLEFSGGRFDINTCRNLNVMRFKERNDSGKESKNVSSRSARVLA